MKHPPDAARKNQLFSEAEAEERKTSVFLHCRMDRALRATTLKTRRGERAVFF